MKHSPAPWSPVYVGSGDWHIVRADGEEIAAVWNAEMDETVRGNAYLMAAAPELLELMRLLVMPARVAQAAGMSVEAAEITAALLKRADELLRRIEDAG